jgi:hypothetical protein
MNDVKGPLIFCGAFLVLFAMIFITAVIDSNHRQECRSLAMQRNMTSAEIQAVCR